MFLSAHATRSGAKLLLGASIGLLLEGCVDMVGDLSSRELEGVLPKIGGTILGIPNIGIKIYWGILLGRPPPYNSLYEGSYVPKVDTRPIRRDLSLQELKPEHPRKKDASIFFV